MCFKRLFYFYTAYGNVLSGLVPNSRKDGNMYCIPMLDSYRPEKIEELETYLDIEKYWYKEGSAGNINRHKNDHYDGSRYHDFNLHSLWNRHGTIEIRSHSSTTDAKRILLWVALHQAIVDKIASGTLVIEDMKGVTKINDVGEKTKHMLSRLCLPSHLDMYVRRLINHFNLTNI